MAAAAAAAAAAEAGASVAEVGAGRLASTCRRSRAVRTGSSSGRSTRSHRRAGGDLWGTCFINPRQVREQLEIGEEVNRVKWRAHFLPPAVQPQPQWPAGPGQAVVLVAEAKVPELQASTRAAAAACSSSIAAKSTDSRTLKSEAPRAPADGVPARTAAPTYRT